MAFDAIQNYYEKLVFDEIVQHYWTHELSEDELEDIACIALNTMSPRYIRHHVDLCFFMSQEERNRMVDEVKIAVAFAYKKVFS
ncbi:Late competence development protein ComFB [Thiomicrospira aerophila AL3]|uniref:Late competence development protein ComFB n=1 Tax=Thiomicrospira aerophila AL3 TaxID=717772 RepID=W0DQ54_9GAMM|nr:late competence development ComFB family protein [Thiomicrospira aerophila]AHF00715.1 Late competence development protein ComFB [Thiomicrospira aerophila AL3]